MNLLIVAIFAYLSNFNFLIIRLNETVLNHKIHTKYYNSYVNGIHWIYKNSIMKDLGYKL